MDSRFLLAIFCFFLLPGFGTSSVRVATALQCSGAYRGTGSCGDGTREANHFFRSGWVMLGGSSQLGYVVNNHGDRKSPRSGVVGPLPNGLSMAYK